MSNLQDALSDVRHQISYFPLKSSTHPHFQTSTLPTLSTLSTLSILSILPKLPTLPKLSSHPNKPQSLTLIERFVIPRDHPVFRRLEMRIPTHQIVRRLSRFGKDVDVDGDVGYF